MQPQEFSLVNTTYFADITAHVNGLAAQAAQQVELIQSTVAGDVTAEIAGLTARANALKAELQGVVSDAMGSIQAEVTAIKSQVAALVPLITMPHDLGSVIGWITNFATPMMKPYIAYTSQLTQTMAEITSLTSAIENAVSSINLAFPVPTLSMPRISITITIPTIL